MKTDIIIINAAIIVCLFLILIPGITLGEKLHVDLGITGIETQPSSSPGSPFYGSISVVNYGDQISMDRTVTFYLSKDKEINSVDYPIGSIHISFIKSDESVHREIRTVIPDIVPPGTYYAGAALEKGFNLAPDQNSENDVISGSTVTINSSYTRPQEWYNSIIADRIFELSNYERTLRKLDPLTRDEDLDVIALEHSRDMSARDFFDHINPDGENPADRADRHHYDQERILSDGSPLYGIAENIVKIPVDKNVYGFGEIVNDDPDEIASVAVESFMDSPPHKEALLLPVHEKIGIGVAFDGEFYYITQNFF